ncbi:MAG: low affinity iron permease family protein [bacterium]|nr:low affinity iron permease family protein [bacterium]
MKETFRKISQKISIIAGSAWVFILALVVVATWAFSGSYFDYSNTWQLVINTGTTIVTFLMVFLIQNTQNRDSKSLHLKLDELLRSSKGARESFMDLDNLSDDEIRLLDEEFKDVLEKKGDSTQITRIRAKLAEEKARRHGIKYAGEAFVAQLRKPLDRARDIASSTEKSSKDTKNN